MLLEIIQLHGMGMLSPLNTSKTSRKDRAEATEYLMLLTEKRYRIVKGRTYYDRRKSGNT